jgi:catecholate siderophore receptor
LLALSAFPATAQDSGYDAAPLETIVITGAAPQSDGYRATQTRVGKTLQDPHDVPQAVTTLTSALLDEQQAGSLKEAMRNVAGLSFNSAEGGRAGDNMNLRGFYTFGDMYLDGIRDTAQYNREIFATEQIDVLRGAGAMLFGRGQAGGVINQVSKLPLAVDQGTLGASLGTRDYQEATADINQLLDKDTAVRINLMRRDEGSARHNPATGTETEIHRQGAALSLALNRRSANQWWLNHYQLDTDDNPDYGIPFDSSTRAPAKQFTNGAALDATTFWGTDATFDLSRTRITTLVNEYRFSGVTQVRTQLRSADYERSYWARTPSLSSAPNAQALVVGVGGTANGGPTRTADYETLTLQSDFSTKTTFAGMPHELLAGIEWLKENSFRHSLQNLGGTTASNPPRYAPYVANTSGTPVAFVGDSLALYAQDTVEFFPQWKATLGIRYDTLDADYSSVTSPRLSYGENSLRAALSYAPTIDTHYYLGWSDSFSPTADLYQLTVTPLPPETSEVVELGAKWLLLDGDLALRASLYRATKHWERNADLESTAAILTKKRRTDGLELEAAGRISEHWEVFAGLALMDARILEVAENVNATTGVLTRANPAYAGKRARNTPRYTANLWTTYDFAHLPAFRSWKIGGGVEAKGDREVVNPSGSGAVPTLNGVYHPNTAPAYVRWDAMLSFEQPRWAVRLNLKNVFDTVYWDAVYDNGGFAIPGARRQVIATTEWKF